MLIGDDAIKALAARTDEAEGSRSDYWEHQIGNFQVAADGTMTGQTALGNASKKVSLLRNFAHAALQRPLHRLAAPFPDLADCVRLGRQIARRQNRQFTYDMLRQSFTLALIRNYLDISSGEDCSLVIGDGYGVMTTLLLMHAPRRKVITVNLTKPLLLDLAYSRQAVPEARLALVESAQEMRDALADGGIRLIAVRADDADCIGDAAIGLAINILSMQEMDSGVVKNYFRLLRGNRARQTAFYCSNKEIKVTNFDDYPWRPGDTILHDSICEWSQWNYSARPPFWHRRPRSGKLIRHRLALLEMENT